MTIICKFNVNLKSNWTITTVCWGRKYNIHVSFHNECQNFPTMFWLLILPIFSCTSVFSLKYMNIAMVTILKNVTNILTAVGELYIFRKPQKQKVWTAMFLMVNNLSSFFFLSWFFQDLWCCMLHNWPKQKHFFLQTFFPPSRFGGIRDISISPRDRVFRNISCRLQGAA